MTGRGIGICWGGIYIRFRPISRRRIRSYRRRSRDVSWRSHSTPQHSPKDSAAYERTTNRPSIVIPMPAMPAAGIRLNRINDQ